MKKTIATLATVGMVMTGGSVVSAEGLSKAINNDETVVQEGVLKPEPRAVEGEGNQANSEPAVEDRDASDLDTNAEDVPNVVIDFEGEQEDGQERVPLVSPEGEIVATEGGELGAGSDEAQTVGEEAVAETEDKELKKEEAKKEKTEETNSKIMLYSGIAALVVAVCALFAVRKSRKK